MAPDYRYPTNWNTAFRSEAQWKPSLDLVSRAFGLGGHVDHRTMSSFEMRLEEAFNTVKLIDIDPRWRVEPALQCVAYKSFFRRLLIIPIWAANGHPLQKEGEKALFAALDAEFTKQATTHGVGFEGQLAALRAVLAMKKA